MMTIILSVVKAVILGFLAYLVWYDIKYKRVPNKILLVMLPFTALHLVLSTIAYGWLVLLYGILGALFGGGLLLTTAMFTKGGIGGGDIKLAAVLGLATGLEGMIVLLISACIGAMVYAMFCKYVLRMQFIRIAFVPFMTAGYILSVVCNFI